MIMSRFFLLSIVFAVIAFSSQAQSIKLPSWVAMIDNESTNYFEAIKAFDYYWKGKIKPIEEMDLKELNEMSAEEKEERSQYFNSMSVEQRHEYDLLQYHYKRFKQWRKNVFPYVQSDGRILTMVERIAIWEQQQAESKSQQK